MKTHRAGNSLAFGEAIVVDWRRPTARRCVRCSAGSSGEVLSQAGRSHAVDRHAVVPRSELLALALRFWLRV